MKFDRPHLFIDGTFVAGSGASVDVVNPTDATVLGVAATATEDEGRARAHPVSLSGR